MSKIAPLRNERKDFPFTFSEEFQFEFDLKCAVCCLCAYPGLHLDLCGDGAERTIVWWPSWCHFYPDHIQTVIDIDSPFWMTGRQAGSTYLLHGQEQRPQNFPRSFKFFSASFMSLLIWSIPSSMRSSCSDYQHIVIFFFYSHQKNESTWKKKRGGRSSGWRRVGERRGGE